MYYGNIKNCDIADGLGVRVTLFVSGCTHHCRGCFQPETWDFKFGEPYTRETEDRLLSMLAPGYIDGLTLLGRLQEADDPLATVIVSAYGDMRNIRTASTRRHHASR